MKSSSVLISEGFPTKSAVENLCDWQYKLSCQYLTHGTKTLPEVFFSLETTIQFLLVQFHTKTQKENDKIMKRVGERRGVFSKAFRVSLERSNRKKNIAGITKAALHNLLSVWPQYVHIELLVQQKSKKPFLLESHTEIAFWDCSPKLNNEIEISQLFSQCTACTA